MLILRKAYEETIEEEKLVKRRLDKRSKQIETTVWIGKRGVSEAQIKEISKQLNARKRVKVKVLRSALTESTVEEIAQRVASETGSRIIQIIGHTFTLYKPKRGKGKPNIVEDKRQISI